MFIVTSSQMRAAEGNAVSRGTTFSALMENAGRASADIIYSSYCKDEPKRVLIICGKGKNGGDGFVIARTLREKGCEVSVLLACGEPTDGDSLDNFNLLEYSAVNIYKYSGNTNLLKELLVYHDIYVDCLFGTGFRGVLDPEMSLLTRIVNGYGKILVSIDIPSGAVCDTATAEGECFLPDMTIAISALKPIHVMKPACAVCGKVKVADIGIIDADYENLSTSLCRTITREEVKALLPKRKSVSNKGTYGHALCICGSYKMPGAAFMSVKGALRTGAGLVTAAFPKSAYSAMTSKLTECLMLPCDENFDGTFAYTAVATLNEVTKKCSAVLLGCGMGCNQDTARLTENYIKDLTTPIVIDADGLNLISRDPSMLKNIPASVIIPPPPG